MRSGPEQGEHACWRCGSRLGVDRYTTGAVNHYLCGGCARAIKTYAAIERV